MPYYNKYGQRVYNPKAYAKTGAPMYNNYSNANINKQTTIYKLDLEKGKKYIGKTTDIDKRLDQHFSGNGSEVTKKFKPVNAEVIDSCPGYLSNELEQAHTDKNIEKHGYNNVRGGKYVNSKTLK